MTEHVTTDPWSELAAEGARLHGLYQQGQSAEVLAAVQEHLKTMADLPDPTGADQPWAIREAMLGLGVAAAHGLSQWDTALELNAAIQRSQEERDADDVERALAWFNDYGPLLQTGRALEARELLFRCRVAFGRAEDITMMGNTLSALADVDGHLGQLNRAIDQETDALRMKYRGSDPEAVAVSHYNLANYLIRATNEPRAVWAHRLAAAVIRYQTESPRLTASVRSIGRLLGDHAEESVSPLSFDEVCVLVDGLPEVRFTELFALLPDRTGGGQAAVDEVMRLTATMRDSTIQESVAAWEPVISALVAAQQPDPPADVEPLLEDAFAELWKQVAWRELVNVLRRIHAGPDFYNANIVDNLDPVSAAVAGRAKAAVTGQVSVDPTMWRTLIEQA
jgi:hypothetical protein